MLWELPKECWTRVPNDVAGYQYMVTVHVGSANKSKGYTMMADGGAGVNTIPESTLV